MNQALNSKPNLETSYTRTIFSDLWAIHLIQDSITGNGIKLF